MVKQEQHTPTHFAVIYITLQFSWLLGGGNTHTQSHIHSALVVVKIKFIVVAYETQGLVLCLVNVYFL